MGKLEMNLPTNFSFETELSIRLTDLNYGGHMGNDRILVYAQEARQKFFNNIQCSETELFGVGTIMTDAQIVFKSEGFFNNEIIIKVAVTNINKYGFELFYLMQNLTTKKDLAWAKTGIVCFDYEKRKIQLLPKPFSDLFE